MKIGSWWINLVLKVFVSEEMQDKFVTLGHSFLFSLILAQEMEKEKEKENEGFNNFIG